MREIAIPEGLIYKKDVIWETFYLGNENKRCVFNQIHTWTLVNILLILTGKNKEVITSIPSTTYRRNESILKHASTLADKNKNDEIELYGFKNRSATAKTAIKRFVLSTSSAIYKELIWYEKNLKNNFEGNFFELSVTDCNKWLSATVAPYPGVKNTLPRFFQFWDKDGNLHQYMECLNFHCCPVKDK